MSAVSHLPKQDIAGAPTHCCPQFVPADWDDKHFEFKDKLFMKVRTRSLFHIPLNMGLVLKRAMAAIIKADADAGSEYLLLSQDVSAWKAEHLISVCKDVPGAEMVHISGTFVTKVFEGPFQDAAKWYEVLVSMARARGDRHPQIYFFYTTCPKCAKVYGKNYVVGFLQLK